MDSLVIYMYLNKILGGRSINAGTVIHASSAVMKGVTSVSGRRKMLREIILLHPEHVKIITVNNVI